MLIALLYFNSNVTISSGNNIPKKNQYDYKYWKTISIYSSLSLKIPSMLTVNKIYKNNSYDNTRKKIIFESKIWLKGYFINVRKIKDTIDDFINYDLKDLKKDMEFFQANFNYKFLYFKNKKVCFKELKYPQDSLKIYALVVSHKDYVYDIHIKLTNKNYSKKEESIAKQILFSFEFK